MIKNRKSFHPLSKIDKDSYLLSCKSTSSSFLLSICKKLLNILKKFTIIKVNPSKKPIDYSKSNGTIMAKVLQFIKLMKDGKQNKKNSRLSPFHYDIINDKSYISDLNPHYQNNSENFIKINVIKPFIKKLIIFLH